MIQGEALKGHLDLILLAALERGPAYGYSIVAQIQAETGGSLTLSDGTIYPALHRLERARMLTSFYEVSAGRRRRIYRVTEAGEDELERLKGEWAGFAGAIHKIFRRKRPIAGARGSRGA